MERGGGVQGGHTPRLTVEFTLPYSSMVAELDGIAFGHHLASLGRQMYLF